MAHELPNQSRHTPRGIAYRNELNKETHHASSYPLHHNSRQQHHSDHH